MTLVFINPLKYTVVYFSFGQHVAKHKTFIYLDVISQLFDSWLLLYVPNVIISLRKCVNLFAF